MYAYIFIQILLLSQCNAYKSHDQPIGAKNKKMQVVFAWKQMSYDLNGILYTNETDLEYAPNEVQSTPVAAAQKFFIPYNNVPIGFEVWGDRVFVTVPNRRYGIPSTLNYVYLPHTCPASPSLRPYPSVEMRKNLFSVYRPRIDECGRMWVVDTGVIEVPGDRRQVQAPSLVIYDLHNDEELLRHELNLKVLVNERTSAGLTSLAVEVLDAPYCQDAYAYINDLATEGLVVFSLKRRESWRVEHSSFIHDENAVNFTVAGNIIPWKDGLFSIALVDKDRRGRRAAFYHPLVSTQEFVVDTDSLRHRRQLDNKVRLLGHRGPNTQSGSHAYHAGTRTILYANVVQDAILCWNIDKDLTPENVAMVAQDHEKLVYISDLKIIDDHVWVLANQIPNIIYSTLNPNKDNYFILRGSIQNLIKGTVCDRRY